MEREAPGGGRSTMTEQTKSEKINGKLEHKAPGFLRRNRVYFVGFFGLLGLHIMWDRLNDVYVPEDQRTETKVLRYLRNLNPFPRE